MKFYFTYGSDDRYPFKGGWTEVIADSQRMAIAAFSAVHPMVDDHPNYASMYSEDMFIGTTMYKHSNFGARCNETIELTITEGAQAHE